MNDRDLDEVTPVPISQDEFNDIVESEGIDKKAKNEDYTLRRILGVLTKIQKYSIVGFVGFTSLHLVPVAILPGLGVPMEINQQVFEMTRAVYFGVPFFEQIAIFGGVFAHILSGMGIRIIRSRLSSKISNKANRKYATSVVVDEKRDDIGLGGLGALVGLQFHKSAISRIFPNVTPLQFSGYLFMITLGIHCGIFRIAPQEVDGDSSLVSLKFISYLLNNSTRGKIGNSLNFFAIFSLLLTGSYHAISGLLKYNRRFSRKDKRNGYITILIITGLGSIGLLRFKKMPALRGFLAESYSKYILISSY